MPRNVQKCNNAPIVVQSLFRVFALALLSAYPTAHAWAQSQPQATGAPHKTAQYDFRTPGQVNWLVNPYRVPVVQPSRSENSDRLASLLRNGTLYLSLQDAIDLAVENNFDIEIQRFVRQFALTDLLRAKAGGTLRNVITTIRQLPAGVGGPGEPLLTTVGGYSPVLQLPSSSANLATITETQTDPSVLASTPLSSGPAIPQFDAALNGQVNLSQQNTPQPSPFTTGSNLFSSHSLLGNVGFVKGFSTGTAFQVNFTSNRQSENSTRLNLNPFTTGDLSVSLVQPLLQGFGLGVNRRFIRMAKNEHGISAEVFRQQLISTVSDVIRLYWDLVSLREDVGVKRESLVYAERLYEDTKVQVDQGTQAPIQLTQAQASMASSRQDLNNAEGLVLQQELLLKEVLTRRGVSDPALADARIVSVTKIEEPGKDSVPALAALVEGAQRDRPDFALAQGQIENTKLSLKGSRNALLPELNLVASFQNNGLAGRLNNLAQGVAAPDPVLLGGYGDMVSQIFKRNFPDYVVGIQLNIPLQNRIAKADAARDLLQFRQSEVRLQQLASQIRLEVGNAWIALERAKVSYEAAAEARKLQEKALVIEKEKFDAGASITYNLIQHERDLAQARSAVVTAQGIYAKAKAALDRAIGSTLLNNNIVLEEAYQGKVTRAPSPAPDSLGYLLKKSAKNSSN
jgi:outer membrane protein